MGTQVKTSHVKVIALLVGALLASAIAVAPAQGAYADDLAAGSIDDQALTAQTDAAEHEVAWQRIYGETALDTMAKIVQYGWTRSDVVVIATSDGYWDALAASSLAGSYHAPVMFTERDSLSPQTRAELERLVPKKAFIIGGTAAVSADVESQVSAMGLETVRLAGDNAMGTAIAVANAIAEDFRSSTCIIATLAGYWDALSASPYSYAKRAPIFLTNGDGELEGPTLDAIKAGGYTRVVIAGGNLAVMPSVDDQLAAIGVGDVQRCWGQTAYDTAVELSNWEVTQGMSWSHVGIATGNGYWDALAGAALCGLNNSVLLLADADNNSAATSRLSAVKNEITIGTVFGGDFAVSEGAYNNLQQSTSNEPPKTEEQLRIESLNGWWQSIGMSGMYWRHFVNGTIYFYYGDLYDSNKFTHSATYNVDSMPWYDVGQIGAAKNGSCSVVKIDNGPSARIRYTTYVQYDNNKTTLNYMSPDGSGYSGSSSMGRMDGYVPASLLALAAEVEPS